MKAEKIPRKLGDKTFYIYPAQIKEKIVEEIESEAISIIDATIKYEVTRSTLKTWIKTYGHGHRLPDALQHSTKLHKRQIINEIGTGKLTFLEALKKYRISERTLYNWKNKYSNDIVYVKTTGNMKNNEEATRSIPESKHLEELRLKVIALETMIDIAEKEFNIPIRKKHGSKQ